MVSQASFHRKYCLFIYNLTTLSKIVQIMKVRMEISLGYKDLETIIEEMVIV